MRAASVASLPGRPSRRKKEPGILPMAYIRSSKSTVSGKKSMPGRGSPSLRAASSTVSPKRIVQAAVAFCASSPVAISRGRPSISVRKTRSSASSRGAGGV